ncbi:hypothetical protein BCV70DRAFT_156734 [Testicularia cyperi]|uniref:RanBD1 domain-containing protein n=1 Tax=Testicularia cyperi TaxID=1882483 RepID=A0A317XVD8_9BASI|nr:hypothetical protein BCV70DRAFT_156734 [Testicularia cyperi]
MAPSRRTRSAAAATISSSGADDASVPSQLPSSVDHGSLQPSQASSRAGRTPTRASPYVRTPTKQLARRSTGPSTPASVGSPRMIKEIFQIISPFRTFSRASRSAAFGGDQDQQHNEQPPASHDDAGAELGHNPDNVEGQQPKNDTHELQAMDVEDEQPQPPSSKHLLPLSAVIASQAERSSSPISRASLPLPAPLNSLPLADRALVTPGIHRHGTFQHESAFDSAFASSHTGPTYAPSNTSPVSRNYDLLARFFAEKQRGGDGGLSEVEVEGCMRLIEESMAAGRDLESEFDEPSPAPQQRSLPRATSDARLSSRANSVASNLTPAFPASQTMGSLFHPGSTRLPASSSAYSFLAPRPSASTGGAFVSNPTRRRPIYLGPGMSGLSLNRRRTLAPSSSSAASRLAATSSLSSMSRSTTDPSLARHTADDERQLGREEAKRRRTVVAAVDSLGEPSALASASPAKDRHVHFDPAYRHQSKESSALAKEVAESATASPGPASASSPLKRSAPGPSASSSSSSASPVKTSTRTASAIQDILKASPPVRAPIKPELVNPYQSSSGLGSVASKKREAGSDATSSAPVRRSARTSMLTRAKAQEAAQAKASKAAFAADKASPPKESVLELIERTAPKTRASTRKVPVIATSEGTSSTRSSSGPSNTTLAQTVQQTTSQQEHNGKDSDAARKAQKTEEVQRRLEALTKGKGAGPSLSISSASKQPATSASDATAAHASATSNLSTASLVPPQYTASKPKKPSPLSVAFQAPESPGSDAESSKPDTRISKPTIAPLSFGSSAAAPAASVPSSGFSFSAPKPASTNADSSPAAASSSTTTGFTFLPLAGSVPAAKPPTSGGFTFSPPKPTGALSAQPSTPVANAATSSKFETGASVKGQVQKESVDALPSFDFTLPTPSVASSQADRAVRDEIRSVAQSALPNFDFIYEIAGSASANKGEDIAHTKPSFPTTAPSAPSTAAPGFLSGFGFAAPAALPPVIASPAPPSTGSTLAPADAASPNAGDAAGDPSKTQSSGLLGEGEGEESETTIEEARAKIWKLDMETKAWKDLGVCIAKIKSNTETGKNRLLARNEANGKVAVNFMVYKGITVTQDKTVNSFLGFEDGKPTQYRFKVKLEDKAKEFKTALENAAAKA